MTGIRKNYNYYIRNGLPVPAGMKPKKTGWERRTWLWYHNRGLTPPAHLKPPKAIREGATNVMTLTIRSTATATSSVACQA